MVSLHFFVEQLTALPLTAARWLLQNGFFPQVVVFLQCSREITVAIIQEPAKQQYRLRKQNKFVWLVGAEEKLLFKRKLFQFYF